MVAQVAGGAGERAQARDVHEVDAAEVDVDVAARARCAPRSARVRAGTLETSISPVSRSHGEPVPAAMCSSGESSSTRS
ncbi:hypothetical protein BJF79_00950 [Actinomadura sp. CNU-125]|nr:hypothetical protein BJF79_00950 [Actinomadura sp. CNU-125]